SFSYPGCLLLVEGAPERTCATAVSAVRWAGTLSALVRSSHGWDSRGTRDCNTPRGPTPGRRRPCPPQPGSKQRAQTALRPLLGSAAAGKKLSERKVKPRGRPQLAGGDGLPPGSALSGVEK